MDVAEVIVTSGIFSDAKLSQDCCADVSLGAQRSAANRTANEIACKHRFI
jgi:hypothetical protein